MTKVKRITIIETRNGYLIVDGEATTFELPRDLAARSWSYGSIANVITQIRKVLSAWREGTKAAETSDSSSDTKGPA